MKFNYYMPSRLLFGAGALNQLAEVELPGKKALIITGGTSTTRLGYVDRVKNLLSTLNVECEVYADVEPNPTIQNVHDCANICRTKACDFVIGLGGGSSIDTSKAAAVMATNDGDYWDYICGGSGKGKPVANSPLPIVAITTTAGTGTEADPWTVVTNGEEKIGFGYDKTFPVLSIIDPELMQTVPSDLTAYQGFDALFHATEGYIAKIANPMSDIYALQSIRLIGKSLAKAVNDGSDMDARADVAFANTLSGFVESTSSCTSEHSIEHSLSGMHHKLPHGAGLIMICQAYYTRFLGVCDDRFIDMARALGKADADKPEDFLTALYDVQKACGVDNLKMSDYGIDINNADMYAKHAMETMGGLFDIDRIKLSVEDVADIIRKSYK